MLLLIKDAILKIYYDSLFHTACKRIYFLEIRTGVYINLEETLNICLHESRLL